MLSGRDLLSFDCLWLALRWKTIPFSAFGDELPIGGSLALELRFELWIAFFSRKPFELKGVLQIFGN